MGNGMGRIGIIAWIGVTVLAGGGAIALPQNGFALDGATLYLNSCSMCHGLIAKPSASPGQPVVAGTFASSVTLTSATSILAIREPRGRVEAPAAEGPRLAIAPPYGPTLTGVFGRTAGTVPGYLYSDGFREVLRGVVWNRETLHRWITDSQAWVPTSVMIYKQPDADVRTKIIDFLEANR